MLLRETDLRLGLMERLARYALFAGVGSRTTVGMGQARQAAERG